MLQVKNLHKRFGSTVVLRDISFTINPGDRVGLIGANGSGKSTLLRCLAGLERPDGGEVARSPRDLRVGYLAQEMAGAEARTVGDVLASARAEVVEAGRALEAAAARLAAEP
ncbi:MAG: ABC-F family ATP-binding cassette domain-containing protein, partial [Thermomicrobiaceae bacterium]|nr:ABC-F family ATP-binding cassette domain-containing protein [Thermomicrobiaceae bacterium]